MTDRDLLPMGDKVRCNSCGTTISTCDDFCAYCGARQHISTKAVTTPSNNWFSQAGSLDDSLDSGYTPPKSVPVNTPTAKTPAEAHPTSTEGVTFIKPVKGPKTTPATPVYRESKPVEPVNYEPKRVAPAVPVKEEPRCKKCGVVVPKGTTLCWKCSSATSIAEKTVAKTEKVREGTSSGNFFTKNMIPILISASASVVLIIVILLFMLGGPLNERKIISRLPESITSIYVNNELVPLSVDKLKIEKRKTQKGVDNVYCVIELSSDTLAVTKYQQLTFVKYNGNKWIMDWNVPYATEDVRILKASDELYEWAIGRIEESDDRYANIESYITNYDVTINDRTVTYVFDINRTIGLMSITGQIAVESTLAGDEYDGYYWRGWPDDSAVQVSWDVDGTWNGGMSNWGMGWYELTLDIDALNREAITCTWYYDQDGSIYSGDSSKCYVGESDAESIEFGVHYGSGLLSYISVIFYLDGTCVASVPFLGDFNLELQ